LCVNSWFLEPVSGQPTGVSRPGPGQQPYRLYDGKALKADPRLNVLALDSVGRLIGGGSRGAVLYDGSAWHTIRLRNHGAVSAVGVSPANEIFVGGYNELGRILQDSTGQWLYRPLLDSIRERDVDLNTVWGIFPTSRAVYFVTDYRLVAWENGELVSYISDSLISAACLLNDRLVFAVTAGGLYETVAGGFRPFPGGTACFGRTVQAILPRGDFRVWVVLNNLPYAVENGQLVPVRTAWADWLSAGQYAHFASVDPYHVVVGSKEQGIAVVDTLGQVVQVWDRSRGLPAAGVQAVVAFPNRTCWLALGKGLVKTELMSPLTFLPTPDGLDEAPEWLSFCGEQTVVAAADRLFSTTGSATPGKLEFRPLNTPYSLELQDAVTTDSSVILVGSTGVFRLGYRKGSGLELISARSDNRGIIASGCTPQTVYVVGSGKLDAYSRTDNGWRFVGQLDRFREAGNSIMEDSLGWVWVGTDHSGICRIDLRTGFDDQAPVQFFDTRHGLPSISGIRVFNVQGRVVVWAGGRLYRHDPARQGFSPDPAFSWLPDKPTNRVVALENTADGRTWLAVWVSRPGFPTGGLEFYVSQARGTPLRWESLTALARLRSVDLLDWVHTADSVQYLLTSSGIYTFDERRARNHRPLVPVVRLRSVQGVHTQLLFPLRPVGNNLFVEVPYFANSLRFDVGTTRTEDESEVLYSYWLQGYDADWSGWTHDSKRLYDQLPPGQYTLRVRVRSVYGVAGEPVVYMFRVGAPFHQTWLGMALLLSIAMGFGWAAYTFYVNRLRRQREILEEMVAQRTLMLQLNQAELKESNEELVRLNEQLREAAEKQRAEQARLTREMEEARAMQQAMLPQRPPEHPSLEIGVYHQPATEVGGDYYDFDIVRKDPESPVFIAVGDATGHGLRASFLVSTTKSYFKHFVRRQPITELFEDLSVGIFGMNLPDMYMALTVFEYDPVSRTARVVVAGMPEFMVYRADTQTVEVHQHYGLFLGFPQSTQHAYTPLEISLAAGDVVLLMTDGLAERFTEDDIMLGYKRIATEFEHLGNAPAQTIVDTLAGLGDEWINGLPPPDDTTLMAIRIVR
jgi:serine phosphatase RsbU (regulator of sigma subunit)